MKLKYMYAGVITLMLTFTACKDSFLDTYPKSSITSATFYQNSDDFIKAVNGIYNGWETWRQSMEYIPWIDMCTPIAVKGGSRFGAFEWGRMDYSPTTMHGDQIGWWGNWYKIITRSNEVIKRIEGEEGLNIKDESLKSRLKGEALFMRALSYYFLTNLWGDVPLLIEPITENHYVAKSPKTEVVAQMIKDLQEAETLLPSVTTYRNTANMGRASKGAAIALLGKVYCFNEQWKEAKSELEKLIIGQNKDDYALTPGQTGFNDQFWPTGENGIESIFEIQYQSGLGDALGNAFITFCATGGTGIDGGGGGNNYIEPTDYLTDLYETKNGYSVSSQAVFDNSYSCGYFFNQTSNDPAFETAHPFNNRDPRLKWTVMYDGSTYINEKFPGNTFTGKIPKETPYATVKYIVHQSTAFQSDMNMIILRYADVLLLYAEALVELNQLDASGGAAKYINMVRSRQSVNMPNVSASIVGDQSKLRTYLRQERIRELACEFGHVLFDMKRWKIYGDEMRKYWTANKLGHTNSAIKFNDVRDYLWPIPQNELDVNPNLTQNPGY